MIRELKYLFYILVIFIFSFLSLKFYFSDDNKKNSYRSLKLVDDKIIIYSQNLIMIKNNTNNIVEYVEKTIDKNKNNYNFWNLISNNNE
jgi:hypothetical protein|tara:strand:- start:937 stop:1203 length:267 start_codon:yes stop_codon:yes gene_type:complete